MFFLGLIYTKARAFFRTFIFAPKSFEQLGHCDVLIYDKPGSEIIARYFDDQSYAVLCVRGEKVFVFAFLTSCFRSAFWLGKPLKAYEDSVIDLVRPKLIITFTDNNPNFYQISLRWPLIKTAFIQNGVRGGPADIFEKDLNVGNYHVDFMYTFSMNVGRQYLKSLTGTVIPIGSLKNNHFYRDRAINRKSTRDVIFVSQFVRRKHGDKYIIQNTCQRITYSEFYAPEFEIINLLSNWCEHNGADLKILGRDPEHEEIEKDFFRQLSRGKSIDFVKRANYSSPYEILDEAGIVVFIDSTLGYEALARGNRVAAFPCRGEFIGSSQLSFGWPFEAENTGDFWSNEVSNREIERVMNFAWRSSEVEWKKSLNMVMPSVMIYDPENRIISEHLRSLF